MKGYFAVDPVHGRGASKNEMTDALSSCLLQQMNGTGDIDLGVECRIAKRRAYARSCGQVNNHLGAML